MKRTLLGLLLCTGLALAEPAPRLVVPVPHSHPVSVLRESPDGAYLASGDMSGVIKIWDESSRQLQQTLSSQRGGFMPFWLDWLDSDRLICYGNDFRYHLYDVRSGQQLATRPDQPLRNQGGAAQAAGRLFFCPQESSPPVLQQWDPIAWTQQASWPLPGVQAGDSVYNLSLNRQGTRACLLLASGKALELSLPDGKVNWQMEGMPDKFTLLDYGPDGETLLGSSPQGVYLGTAAGLRGPYGHPPDHKAHWVDGQIQYLWQQKLVQLDPQHLESDRVLGSKAVEDGFAEGVSNHQLVVGTMQGKVMRAVSAEPALNDPPFSEVRYLAYDRNGRIYAGLAGGPVVCWSLQNGTRETLLEGRSPVQGLALSGDGKVLLVSRKGEPLEVYDAERLQSKGKVPSASGLIRLQCSEDGRYLVGLRDSKLEVCDLQSGTTQNHASQSLVFALSRQGAPRLAVAEAGQVVETDLSTGQRKTYANYHALALEYDPRGNLFALDQLGPKRLILQPVVERKLQEIMASPVGSRFYAFQPRQNFGLRLSYDVVGQRWLMVGDSGQVFHLSDKPEPIALLPDAGNWSSSPLSPLPNGSFVSVGREQTLEFWKPEEATPSGQLLVLNQGVDWLVTDRSGLFDGTPVAERQIEWLVDNRKVRVDQIFEKAYRPGLLKSFGSATARSAAQAPVAGLRIQPPEVSFQSPAPGAQVPQRIVEVRIGVKDMGGGAGEPRLFVNGKAVPQAVRREGGDYLLQAPLQAGVNELRCSAMDKSGTVESRGDRLRVTCTAVPARKPKLIVVALGVNQAGNAPKLSFAEKDAQSLSEKLQSPLFESSEVRLLTGEKARTEVLRRTFEELGKDAQPQDTLVLFLAGHGSLDSQGYHFLMAPGQPSVDGPILAQWLREFPAQKQFVILDTCHAGAVSDEIASSFALSQQRMARGSGVYMLAACRSDQSALELPSLQHGLLTYSLLEGLNSAPPNSRQQVTVSGLVYYVCSQVPDLCRQVGLNQDVFQFVSGTDFPIRQSGKP
ncbi:MAG: caspase family protein [Candidatus Eremiobacteraeota bacterium]|nr:caspase family protein [Candidatus Eremiobacteraeota bacterium]MCW5871698.1 caspase family protein [Candidatus Eremiobacteraeota bacterium]